MGKSGGQGSGNAGEPAGSAAEGVAVRAAAAAPAASKSPRQGTGGGPRIFFDPPFKFPMLQIPFYSNTKDDLHCVQASLKSALKFYFPKRNWSFLYLDRVTKHKKGKFTWNSAMLIFLARLGFEVIDIEDFDYRRFGEAGEKFLQHTWPKQVFALQKRYSDLRVEQQLAKKLVKTKGVNLGMRPATLKDVKKFFSDGYLIFCSINPYVLKHQKGYTSHMVLLTDVQKNRVVFHDPGLPPVKNRTVPPKLFFRAMCYPTKAYANLIAIKRRAYV